MEKVGKRPAFRVSGIRQRLGHKEQSKNSVTKAKYLLGNKFGNKPEE